MRGHSPETNKTSMLRSPAIRLFQIFIVICLINGFLDISYPLLIATKNYIGNKISLAFNSEAVEPGSIHDILRPLPKITSHDEPGIHGIVNAYHSVGTNVAPDGMRSNGQLMPDKASSVGFILGSSTAFGFGVADNQTFAAHLEKRLKNVRVENYAGVAQPVADSVLRWYDLQKNKAKPDFVIIAGAGFQLYHDCMPDPASKSRKSMLPFLAELVVDTFFSTNAAPPCSSNESLDLAVRHSIMERENAVAFGRKQGIPFHVVYLPTPYDADVNVDNLLNDPKFKSDHSRMKSVYSRYHEELNKLDLPEFINLGRALPSDRMYFLDAAGHLSIDGHRRVADILAERIWGD